MLTFRFWLACLLIGKHGLIYNVSFSGDPDVIRRPGQRVEVVGVEVGNERR